MNRLHGFIALPLRRIALVVALHNAWFWVPIWVLYYRRFTDYGGVALLEGLSMAVSMAMIVPGGLLSDWLGRKRLLAIAGILGMVGSTAAGLSPNFPVLIGSILLLSLSGGLYTSSIHALIYDTLKQAGREEGYERVLGKFITVQMLSCAVASALGGYLYSLDPRLPWFTVGSMLLGAFFVSLTLEEPKTETRHDSFGQFLREAGRGVRILLKREWRIAVPLILVGIFLTTDSSGLWDIQAVEMGFDSSQLGLLLTLTYLALAFTSSILPRWIRNIPARRVIIGSTLLFSFFWFLSGSAVGIFGAFLLISRSISSVTFDIKASVAWNRIIPSSIRATTLSAISIIRGVPYIAVSWGIGKALDTVGIGILVRLAAVALALVCLSVWFAWRTYASEALPRNR